MSEQQFFWLGLGITIAVNVALYLALWLLRH